MKVINVGDSLSGGHAETFPLRAGRQRLAQLHGGGDYGVARKAVIQLILNGRCVGTATDFTVDDHAELHGRIRLDEELDLEKFACTLIWEHGRICKIRVHKHKVMVDDKSGMVLIDDATGAKIYHG